MKTRTFFQTNELPLFFLLAYLLSWWSAPFVGGGLIPHGPALAAVIVIALTAGWPGLRALWARLTNFRAGWWYLIAPVIVVAYLLAAFIANLLMGATVVSPFPIPTLSALMLLLLMGGQWEEPGWTGFALPKLEERFARRPNGVLLAALAAGFFRAIWHLPLVLYGGIAWYDALFFIFAFQIIIAWLYHKTQGSVPVVMVFHFVSNLLTGSMMLRAFSGGERETYYILTVAFACLTALLIIWRTKFRLGSARPDVG